MNIELNNRLLNYVKDPKNPLYNFTLGKVYEDMGHTAAAASFYIRTAEFGNDDLLTYEALLRTALCFDHQGSRVFTVKGLLLRALALMPERPEAYFLLSRVYENAQDWQESYAMATLGENLKDKNPEEKLITNVEYPGEYGFTFERAVVAWWIGLWDESIYLFRELDKRTDMQWQHIQAVKNNLYNLGNNIWKNPIPYHDTDYERLKFKFKGANKIKQNYSQVYQDMFVLTIHNGKTSGTFLEIGCADPFYGNNTALLEKDFGWTGISIDYDQSQIDKWKNKRTAYTICADATKLDYEDVLRDLKGTYHIDYLQIDCDPASISFETLLKIPFETYKFGVITFEHDHYIDEKSDIRNKSRNYLRSLGYTLVVANVGPDKFNSYEDWWVHPDLVDPYMINKMKNISDKTKRGDDYMLGKINN